MHIFRLTRYSDPFRWFSVCDVNDVACVECTLAVGGLTLACYVFNRTFQNRFIFYISLHLLMVRDTIQFYGDELSVNRPTPELEEHPLSAARQCIFNYCIFHPHVRPLLQNGNGEDYIMRSFVICMPYQILFGRINKWSGLVSCKGRGEVHTEFRWGNLSQR